MMPGGKWMYTVYREKLVYTWDGDVVVSRGDRWCVENWMEACTR